MPIVRTFSSVRVLVSASVLPGQQTLTVPTPFPSIAAAIGVAFTGDTVLVSPGVYNETIDFLGKAILVRSVAGPQTTIIDRQFQGRCVVFSNSEGSSSVLQGFTLTHGRAPDGAPVVSGPGRNGGGGGGIFCTASPTIMDCIVRDNRAGDGSNGSFFEPAGNGGQGGGVFLAGPAVLFNCLIYNNLGGLGGTQTFPGQPGLGAGVAAVSTLPPNFATLVNCTVTRNGLGHPSTAGVFAASLVPGTPALILVNGIIWDNDRQRAPRQPGRFRRDLQRRARRSGRGRQPRRRPSFRGAGQ